MDFIDLRAQQERIQEKLEGNMRAVLRHGQYIMGPEIRELESKLASYVGVKHAVGCASGTDALLMALMALKVGPGDAVFTTPFTFIATAEVICLLGATPIFVDIDPKTFNIDHGHLDRAVQALKRSDRSIYPLPQGSLSSGLNPCGVIPVDLFGLLADYDGLQGVAEKNKLWMIEDAAQSFGAAYRGRKACSFGSIACTSFFPAKPLGCYGDGGMCFTNDDNAAKIMDSIRVHGKGDHKYDNVRIGINGRLDTLQAAILLAKFSIFAEEMGLRQTVASRYTSALANSGVVPPEIPKGHQSAWAQYSILAKDEKHRSALQAKLQEARIPTAIYYPKPLHFQTAFAHLGYKKGDFPISEDYASRVFSIPMHPYLPSEDQARITRLLM